MTSAMFGTLLMISWFSALAFEAGGVPAQEPQPSFRKIALQGPLKVLSTSPRYFVDSQGNPVYLSGSHTHLSLQDREGEPSLGFESLMNLLQEHHHNFTKLWAQEDTIHSPLPYQRVGREEALDGKPKFDLTKLDQTYFYELRLRAAAAHARGIYVDVMLFNGWSVEGKSSDRKVWDRHPFHRANNVNNINGDSNGDGEGPEVHTLKNPAVTAIQEAYVRKIIDSVNDLDNVMYEISNESAPTSENTAWQYHMINYIRQYERTKPKQHPVGMTVQYPNGSNQVLYDSPADWISPNAADGYQTNPTAVEHGKVILNDTDHLWGNGGSAEWVWKSFTRGLNPIFMDVTPPLSNQYSLPQADEIRIALGDTLGYAHRMDLSKAKPHPELCSTTFCLVSPRQEYLVYFPPTRWCAVPLVGRLYKCSFTIDFSGGAMEMSGEWFDSTTRNRLPISSITGGSRHTFFPPFEGASVLYVRSL